MMGLYFRCAMVDILDMQISWFPNLTSVIHQLELNIRDFIV